MSLRILCITGSINQGGAEYQILALSKLLMDKGFDVRVLALTNHNHYLDFIKENDIKYSYIDNNGFKLARIMRAFKTIAKLKPEIVISYARRASSVAMIKKIISVRRFKLIISDRTSLVLPYRDLLFYGLAKSADHIVVNSIPKFNYLTGRFPFLRDRTLFIPNMVNYKTFSSVRHVTSTNASTRLSYVGRISPEKNLLNLIRAIKVVYTRGYDIHLDLVGEAHNISYMAECNNLIDELEMSKQVEYKGATTNILNIYAKTDLLCLVSYHEGFSNVIAEALSAGVPILASDIEENLYHIEHEKNGFLVNERDHLDIAYWIEQYLLLQPIEKELMSLRNKQKAKEIYNEETVYLSFKNLLETQ